MEPLSGIDGEYVNRGVVAGSQVRPTGEAVRISVGKQVAAPAPVVCPTQPQIELIREGDVIKAIDVLCTCGQRMRLHCVY